MLFINKKFSTDELVNENIRFKEVLVIADNGEQLGILTRTEALNAAYDRNLDLLCVAPNAVPPVCRILDYGKYRYAQQKKQKEAKKNQHVTEVKPMRLSPVIDIGDFNTKASQARKWLEEGKKVKVDMRFRGRLITRLDVGKKVMDNFIEELSDISIVEKQPSLEGNTMYCIMGPKRNK
ncbi:MAG: translation initiation factor IF-3 [Erysipelotrichaceae bacterium]|nr:translation initiation factor IF-3 [Erysipelotrichaceae bacterium]